MESAHSKSDLYLAALPLLNARRVQLLDAPRVLTQLAALERRTTARSTGHDVVGKPDEPGAHDDLANAVCGAVAHVLPGASGKRTATWDLGGGMGSAELERALGGGAA